MSDVTFERWGGELPDIPPLSDAPLKLTVRPQDANPQITFERWGEEPKAAPDMGYGRALQLGLRQGATANFGDELSGIMGAGQVGGRDLPWIGPFNPQPILGLGRLGAEMLSGAPGAGTSAYENARDKNRAEITTAHQQYPKTMIAGEVGGSLAVPFGGAARAASMGNRMFRGAVTGAGYGALSGAGEGKTADERLSRSASGGLVGGAVGTAAAPLLGLLGAAGSGIGRAAEPFVNAFRGQRGIEREAGRRVATGIETDRRLGSGLSDAQYQNAQASGIPVTNFDRGGGAATGELARSASNTSLEGQQILRQLADNRFEGQTGRAVTFLRNLVPGLPDTQATRDALRVQARAVNGPAYRQFYSATDHGLWSPELERLTGSPAVVSAMRHAAERGKDRAIADGFGAFNPRVQVTPDGRVIFSKGAGGVPTSPNGQFWDYTYRALRDAGDEATRAGRGSEGNAVSGVARQLRDELDRLATQNGVSLYARARSGAARFFDADDAVTAGENFVRSGMTAREGARGFAAMNAQEQQLFRQSFLSRFIDDINQTGDRINILGKIDRSPDARNKLQLILGPQGYANMRAHLYVEQVMDRLRGTLSNSTTARQLYNLGLAGGGGVGAYGTVNTDPMTIAGGIAFALMSYRGRGIDERISRRVAEMLTSHDPAVVTRGVQMIARNQHMLDALRSFDARLAQVGGQQGTGVPALQSAGIGRAQDDQPNIPRP